MKSIIFCIALIGVLLGSFKYSYALLDTAKITIIVVDEEGKLVENARVGIGFEENSARKEIPVDGITKADGRFSASESCNGYIGFNVKKSGYYMSIGKYNFDKKGLARWEPWNPEITVILRKIENPVPMYARDTSSSYSSFEIPVTGKDVGFDMIMFDWLPPYGKGQVADFFCNLVIRGGEGRFDFGYNVNITFPREFDGIQSIDEELITGSEFKLPRIAPESGYEKSYRVIVDRNKEGSISTFKENRNHIFRVRSEVENGKLKRALYGKIIGDIDFGKKKKSSAFLEFKYYLNPDYTRNLEFDPNQNLFMNLPDYERVRIK